MHMHRSLSVIFLWLEEGEKRFFPFLDEYRRKRLLLEECPVPSRVGATWMGDLEKANKQGYKNIGCSACQEGLIGNVAG